MQNKLTFKIALPVILAGVFIITAFLALEPTRLGLSFYIVLIFVAIYLFFFGFATGQKVSTPVRKILDRATNLSEGDLESRVYLENKDELGDLAKIFNRIAEELQRSRAETETTQQSVDIKVRAKTQSLEETINALEQKVKNRTIELDRLMKELETFRGTAKEKENEIVGLRTELGEIKSKVGKVKAQKEV